MTTQEKQIIEIATELNRILTDGIEIHPNSPIHEKLNRALLQHAVGTRYFFVCTMGKNPNGTIGFNNFDIQTTYGHPTFKRCIELSNEKFPNMYEVTLISISEISTEDWKVFVSEQ